MANSAASEAILFIGAVIAATAMTSVFIAVGGQVAADVEQQGGHMSASIRSDITIINDPSAVQTSPLLILVKNTGSVTLAASETTVLLDGQPSQDLTIDVLGSSDDEHWRAGDVLGLTVNDLSVAAGDHRVRVIAHTGISDTLEFTS